MGRRLCDQVHVHSWIVGRLSRNWKQLHGKEMMYTGKQFSEKGHIMILNIPPEMQLLTLQNIFRPGTLIFFLIIWPLTIGLNYHKLREKIVMTDSMIICRKKYVR